MWFRFRFNLRTAMVFLLLVGFISYYVFANPDAIHGGKLLNLLTKHNSRSSHWKPIVITPETPSSEIIRNRSQRVQSYVQDIRRAGAYDRPLSVVIAELGFDADAPDSFFLAPNFDELWPAFQQAIVTQDPSQSWFARTRRKGLWFEFRKCVNLH